MPRVVPLCALLLFAALGCEKNGSAAEADDCPCDLPECQVEIACWCPAPQCERNGCFDGVLYTCHAYGDCMDQGPAIDCAAQGLTCWETEPSSGPDWSLDGEAFCAPPGCGDRTVQPGEACDDGPENGTRMNACTSACTLPPQAVVDQTNMVGEYADPLPLGRRALQTFTAERSGRLAWIVTDVPTTRLYEEREDGFAQVGTSTRVWRERDGRVQTEHHFLTPVFVEAGRRYAFDLDCASGCNVTVTRGDFYPAGALVSESPDATLPLSAGADALFETWVIEADDGCHAEDAPSCPLACGDGAVSPTCVGGAWACPAVYGGEYACTPHYAEGDLELLAEVGGAAVQELELDRSLALILQPREALELARVELPGARFGGDWPSAQIVLDTARPVHLAWASVVRASREAPMLFDLDPPLRLDAGQTYRIQIWEVSAVPLVDGSAAPAWITAQVVGGAVPLRLWSPAARTTSAE